MQHIEDRTDVKNLCQEVKMLEKDFLVIKIETFEKNNIINICIKEVLLKIVWYIYK